MNHEEVAKEVIANIGGKENVNNAWHCMTRLRFNLKDKDKVNDEQLNKIPGIVGVTYQSDQLQIIIGTHVSDYFTPLSKLLGLETAKIPNKKKARKKASFRCLWIQSQVYSDRLFLRSQGQG